LEVLFIPKNEHLINEEIRDREVRLIDENGEQKGIVPISQALQAAYDAGLDLVKIAPGAVPPVCRVMDYGKYKFEQAKRLKEARKNQNIVEVKEVKLSVGIGDHDYEFKLRNALRFLEDGDKVKASVRFRGREMAHTDLGRQVLMRFAEDCAEKGTMERAPKLEGRSMSLIIASKVK
jgi:translation initiation factor IF-3